MTFGNLPLRRKLTVLVLGSLVSAQALAAIGLIAWDVLATRREAQGDLLSQTRILTANAAAALQFRDPEAAVDTLRAAESRDGFYHACLYDEDGALFASYLARGAEACLTAPPIDGAEFDGPGLGLTGPVADPTGARIGTLTLRNDLGALEARLRAQSITVLLVLIASSFVAFALTGRLQRLVVAPLLELASAARQVSRDRTYPPMLAKHGDDEVGDVVDAFNEMLSEIRARELQLRTANERLEARVTERTEALRAELAERQKAEALLAERNAELLRSNQDLDDFAHIASHDLREPLRGIHNYASFLAEDYAERLDADGLAKLHTLRRLSRRMEDLIEQLLQYSRLGRVDLAIGDVPLEEVVNDVLASLEISLAEARVHVVRKPLPVVRCDRVRVGELYRNLVTNAIKYNDKPDRVIELGYETQTGEPPHLYVRDNGIGIPRKHQDAVFRIFKRLHPREKFGGGTGAGLTIVRKIVERHHGRIWLDSEPGAGTTVYFTLSEGPTP